MRKTMALSCDKAIAFAEQGSSCYLPSFLLLHCSWICDFSFLLSLNLLAMVSVDFAKMLSF